MIFSPLKIISVVAIFLSKKLYCFGVFTHELNEDVKSVFSFSAGFLKKILTFLKDKLYSLFGSLKRILTFLIYELYFLFGSLKRILTFLIYELYFLLPHALKRKLVHVLRDYRRRNSISADIDLVHFLFVENKNFSMQHGLKVALSLYRNMIKRTSAPEIHFLYELARFYDEITKKMASEFALSKAPDALQKFYINVPVWGDQYTSTFLKYMLPSLLAKGNLPKIKNDYSIVLQVFCDHKSAQRIKKSPVYKRLLKVAQVDLYPIPNDIFALIDSSSHAYQRTAKYMLYGTAQGMGAFQTVQEKGLISFFNADIVFGQDSLSRAFECINKGKIGVFVNAFRSCLDSIAYDLESYFKGKNVLEIPSGDLLYFLIKHIHPSSLRRLVSRDNENFNVTAQLLFYDGKNLISRSMHYHPFLISHEFFDKVRFDTGCPLDGDFPKLLDVFEGRFDELFETIEEAQRVGVVELTPMHEDLEGPGCKKRNTYAELVGIISRYITSCDPSLGELFFLSKKTCYTTPHKDLANLLDTYFKAPINDTLFINEVINKAKLIHKFRLFKPKKAP